MTTVEPSRSFKNAFTSKLTADIVVQWKEFPLDAPSIPKDDFRKTYAVGSVGGVTASDWEIYVDGGELAARVNEELESWVRKQSLGDSNSLDLYVWCKIHERDEGGCITFGAYAKSLLSQ